MCISVLLSFTLYPIKIKGRKTKGRNQSELKKQTNWAKTNRLGKCRHPNTGVREFSAPWNSLLPACNGIPGGSWLPLITSWAPLWRFFQIDAREEKKRALVDDWHQWCTTTAIGPGSTCTSRPNSKGHSHCWPRTKGGLWLWSLAGICTIAGAESPFFLLVLKHRACGALPAPHTTGLSHSRLQARAAQCQSTWRYQKNTHTHTGRNKSHAFRLTTKYSPFHVNKILVYNAQHDLMCTTSVYMRVYKEGQMESCYFQRQSIPRVRTMREEFSDG